MCRARVWTVASGNRSPGSFSDPSSLRRHGVSNLNALRPKTPTEPHKAFKTYAPGYLHVDVKYLASRWRMLRRIRKLSGGQFSRRTRAATCSWPSTRCPAGDAWHHREGGNPLGLRAHHARQDRRDCPKIPARPAPGLPDPDCQDIDGSSHWNAIGPRDNGEGKRVHRPALCPTRPVRHP